MSKARTWAGPSRQIEQALAGRGRSRRAASGVERAARSRPMNEMFASLAIGLAVAVAVILVLLTAYFQSPRLALVSVGAVPGVLSGVVLMLFLTRHDAQHRVVHGSDHEHRRVGVQLGDAGHVHRQGLAARACRCRRRPCAAARERLRPILMTACAMTVGMVPMALALEPGSQMQAPLGRAVIGGLVVSTFVTLLILPAIFALVMGRRSYRSPSLHPDDPESSHHDDNRSGEADAPHN